jgi:hypothetical protein
MKRMVLVCALLLVGVVGESFAWGNATHVLVARAAGIPAGPANLHEMYGSVITDMFNFDFSPQGQWMSAALHSGFMPLQATAGSCELKAVFFGVATHNDEWGADWTAHHHKRIPPRNEGYAIWKGGQIAPLLVPELVRIMTLAGVDPGVAAAVAAGLAPEFGHDLSETAVDLHVRRSLDPAVGIRLAIAAQVRPAGVGVWLSDTYAAPLAAATGIDVATARALIIGTEAGYRDVMIQYGLAFALPEDQTIAGLAAQTAPIAEMYIEGALEQAGTPADVTVAPEVIAAFIVRARQMVVPDWRSEVLATLEYTIDALRRRGIRTCGIFFAKGSGEAEEVGIVTEAPAEFALEQNFPNPFNPATRITYTLPAEGRVSLKVFDLLGREVATLTEGVQPAGTHTVLFDGSSLASGMYLYRLEADGRTAVRRMILTK